MEEKFLSSGEEIHQEPPTFGGKPGEPVPLVDPDDLKLAWQIMRDAEAKHPGQNFAIGFDFMKQVFKPGVDIQAIAYRSMLLSLISHVMPEPLERFMRDGQPDDLVFRAAARVPAEWMGVGILREGPPFDVNEFLRLCAEQIETV